MPDLKAPATSAPLPGALLPPEEITPLKPGSRSSAPRRGHQTVAKAKIETAPAARGSAERYASQDLERKDYHPLRTAGLEPDSEAKPLIPGALNGYCPVELREEEKWVTGRSDLRMSYQGQIYHFSTVAAQRRFAMAPEKYVPVQRGNDVVLTVEENRLVPGSIQHTAVWQGQLYLFASSANLAAFREAPSRYVEGKRKERENRQVSADLPMSDSNAAGGEKHAPAPPAREPTKLLLPADSL